MLFLVLVVFFFFYAFKGDATLTNDQLPLVSKVENQDMKIETYFFIWHTPKDRHQSLSL